jgi:TRAP-type mannitol/chloroaromatic compound transport system substrate-binding protein
MNRRHFLQAAMATTLVGSTSAACRSSGTAQTNAALPTLNWQMATSWPVALDTIFGPDRGEIQNYPPGRRGVSATA